MKIIEDVLGDGRFLIVDGEEGDGWPLLPPGCQIAQRGWRVRAATRFLAQCLAALDLDGMDCLRQHTDHGWLIALGGDAEPVARDFIIDLLTGGLVA